MVNWEMPTFCVAMGLPRLLLVVAALCGAQRIPELPSLPVPNEPFAVLEHVNLNSGRAWDRRVDAFYFEVLRCARDSRASHTLTRTNEAREFRSQPALANLSWANVGLQQFHLPVGDGMEDGDGHHFQTMRGEIALLYARRASTSRCSPGPSSSTSSRATCSPSSSS